MVVTVSIAAGYVGSPGTPPPGDSEIAKFVTGWGYEADAFLGPFDVGLVTDGTTVGVQYSLQGNLSAGVSGSQNCSIELVGVYPGLSGTTWSNLMGATEIPAGAFLSGLIAVADSTTFISDVTTYLFKHAKEVDSCVPH